MEDKEWFDLLSKSQKREVLNLQIALNEQGYGKSEDFVMLACWKEAVKKLRSQWPDPDPDKQNYDEDNLPVNSLGKKKSKKKIKYNEPTKIIVRPILVPSVQETATELVDFT